MTQSVVTGRQGGRPGSFHWQEPAGPARLEASEACVTTEPPRRGRPAGSRPAAVPSVPAARACQRRPCLPQVPRLGVRGSAQRSRRRRRRRGALRLAEPTRQPRLATDAACGQPPCEPGGPRRPGAGQSKELEPIPAGRRGRRSGFQAASPRIAAAASVWRDAPAGAQRSRPGPIADGRRRYSGALITDMDLTDPFPRPSDRHGREPAAAADACTGEGGRCIRQGELQGGAGPGGAGAGAAAWHAAAGASGHSVTQ